MGLDERDCGHIVQNNSFCMSMVLQSLQRMRFFAMYRGPHAILVRSEPLEQIYGCFPSMDPVGLHCQCATLERNIYREEAACWN